MRRRIQPRNYYTDPCLTMHQPWASLLVYGIKRIEGRSWPSPIRGVDLFFLYFLLPTFCFHCMIPKSNTQFAFLGYSYLLIDFPLMVYSNSGVFG